MGIELFLKLTQFRISMITYLANIQWMLQRCGKEKCLPKKLNLKVQIN